MDIRISANLGFPTPDRTSFQRSLVDFNGIFNHLCSLLSPSDIPSSPTNPIIDNNNNIDPSTTPLPFSSASMSPMPRKWFDPATRNDPKSRALMKTLSLSERSIIGASAGGIAGAFTYLCLLPLDTVKTKLQTRGAAQIYANAWDAALKTFQNGGILGFYRGVSAVIVGSTVSSAVYFGTCEFGKSLFSKFGQFPPLLIPPAAGAMGNIMSSAIMVPKELITQRLQSGAATGRSWEVVMKILEKDGVLGLYSGYSATLLRNLPAGVLSYSSFEYLKAAVLSCTNKADMEPYQSVVCGALAGAISASITTPLDVVKTRMMTRKIAATLYDGFSVTAKQILTEEGWVGFSSGMGPRVLHSACFSALGYFAFETARLTILHHHLSRRKLIETNEPAT